MKNAIVIISDPVTGTGEAAARMFNGLAMAFDCKEAGDDVSILFHGPGTHWPRHLEGNEHPAHQLYESVKDRISGVSETCAAHFGADVSGFKIIGENVPPNPHGLELSTAHGDAEILRAQQWFEKNLRENVSVESLCQITGLSERTFSRRFLTALGQSPSEYIQAQRVESAKRFLETTRNSFAEITMAVGYADTSSFHRCFRKITGISPGEYRRRFRVGVYKTILATC